MADDKDRQLSKIRVLASRMRISKRNQSSPYHIHPESLPTKLCWTKQLYVLLAGVYDPMSPLHAFRGYENVIIREIYKKLAESWKASILLTQPASNIGRIRSYNNNPENVADQDYVQALRRSSLHTLETRNVPVHSVIWSQQEPPNMTHVEKILGNAINDRPEIAFSVCGSVSFPAPTGINVNMMPFIMGDIDSLPHSVRQYQSILDNCPVQDSEIGKVCYLTIVEGFIEQGETQQFYGLKVEAPHLYRDVTRTSFPCKMVPALEHDMGLGIVLSADEYYGGLYRSSNVADTVAMYDAIVIDRKEIESHGAIEHLRPYIGHATLLRANELVWLTDATPHEVLPQPTSTYNQSFQLVTSDINIWFEDCSTSNPIVPLPLHVQVVKGNKTLPK